MAAFLTLGGRVECRQCNATSKRTKQQCRAPAIRGKSKCRFHGGRSTGPRTPEGKAKVAAAHTTHGRETRQKRLETSYKLAELHYLEQLGFSCGLFPEGTARTRGRKPKHLQAAKENFSHLNKLMNDQKKEAILERLRAIVFE